MFGILRRKIGHKIGFAAATAGIGAAVGGVLVTGVPFTSHTALLIAGSAGAGVGALVLSLHLFVISPLERLARVMARAESGEFLIRAQVVSNDEIGDLARRFNVMLAKITDMTATQIDTEYEKERMRRELALQAELAEKSEELQARVKELGLLIDVASTTSSTLELDEVLATLTNIVGERLGFDGFALLLFDPVTRDYTVTSTYGFPHDMKLEGVRFKEGEGIISLMHERKASVLVGDASQEPRYLHYKGTRSAEGSVLVVPLSNRGSILGALSFARPEVDAFDEREVHLLEAVAAHAALAIDNARLYEQTRALSLTDPLTGLANRRSLEDRLEMEVPRAERFDHRISVLMIDIDHFKVYNDTHGHPMGDEVLQKVAELLRSNVRQVDMVARYGGEEFTVVLPRITEEQAFEVAEKLREAVAGARFPGGEQQPLGRITLSIGVAGFPEDSHDIPSLLDRADIALYHGKERGRNAVVAFSRDMLAASTDGSSAAADDDQVA